MPEGLQFFLVAGAALLLIAYALRSEKKRKEAFPRIALEIGFSFDPAGKEYTVQSFQKLPLFQGGHAQRFRNVLKGATGNVTTLLFDYSYTTGSGRHSSPHNQTVAAFRVERTPLPHFELRPETVFHKIGEAFGYKDVDFEGNPEFSKRYLLRGADVAALKALFHAGVLNYFSKQKGWSVEGEGTWLVLYRGEERVEPGGMRRFLEETRGILNLFAVA
ncbi:MAG: hypothetical protein ABH845_03260 [Candidatus Omnitrophota bacterium]